MENKTGYRINIALDVQGSQSLEWLEKRTGQSKTEIANRGLKLLRLVIENTLNDQGDIIAQLGIMRGNKFELIWMV